MKINKKKITVLAIIVVAITTVFSGFAAFAAGAPSITATPNPANGTMDLEWQYDESGSYAYKVYKKESNGEYQPISSVDFNNVQEPVNVINIYPEASGIPRLTFNYLDGTSATLPKSAALKVWMEGGSYVQDGTTYSFAPVGINPINSSQLIKVTEVSSSSFNANPGQIWNYDVAMFGTWDINGSYDDQPNDAAVAEIKKFLDAGMGVVAGHDTIGYSYEHGLNKIRNYFAVDAGCWGGVNSKTSNYDYNACWGYESTEATVMVEDVLTSYPWYLPVGTKLTIPRTHSCANAARGIVAMQLTNGVIYNGDPAVEYKGTGNPYYYVTRNNNAVMLQTGHSNCNSTEDERKVLANCLFYLKQVTEKTSSSDGNVADKAAPDAVSLVSNSVSGKNVSLSVSRVDNGTDYSYYVEAISKSNGARTTSSVTTANYKTEVKGYSYVVDNIADTQPDDTIDSTSSNLSFSIGDGPITYLHIKAIDNSGNIGPVTHIPVYTNVPPVLDLVPDKVEWTNQNVIITATGTDSDGEVIKIEKPDGTIENVDSTTYEVEENGTYEYTATDNSGATTTETIEITNIDKVDPTATSSVVQPTPTTRAAVIKINASDDLSGVNRIVDKDGVSHAGETLDYPVTEPGTYTFTIYDQAGNSSTIDVDVIINSDGVEVKYVDIGNGNEEISPKVNLSGKVDQNYTTEAKDVEGYELVKIPTNATGKYTIDKQTVVYEYKLNSNVTTRYVDQLTGNKIHDDLVLKYKQDDVYSTSSENIEGYELVKTPTNKTGIVQRENITVTYEYRKVTQGVEIQYIDQATGTKISNSIIKNGVEGTEYTSEAKDIPGYELVKTPENANGEMTVEKTTVKYEYRLISYVTVNYEDEVTRIPLKAPVSTKYLEGQNYTSTQETFDGYTFSRVEGTPNGTMGRTNIVITYYYKSNANVTVKYVDMLDGNREIHDAKTIAGVEGKAYTTEPLEIPGYEYIRCAGKASGNMTVEPITVIYKYKKLATLTTTHIDIDNGQEIHGPVITTYKEGDTYEALPQNIAGYVKVEEPKEKTGVMGRENITRTYKYRKISDGLVVKYVDVKTNEVLDEVVYDGNVGDIITLDRKSFMYYLLYSKPDFDTVTLTNEQQEVIYYYVRSIKMDVIGVDEETGEELFNTKIEGPEGNPYNEEDKKDLDGYELVEMPANAKGNFNRNDTEIRFVYKKLEQKIETSVVAKYIDRDTGKELDSATIIGYVGNPYRTDKKEFAGYELVKIEGNEYGNMEKEQKVVKYIYAKKSSKVIVTYEDEEGNVLDSEELTGKVGEDYEVKVKEIDGYEVVDIPDNAKGEYTEDIIEVKVKLQKIQVAPAEKGTIIVKFVDEEGNEIKEALVTTGDEGETFKLKLPNIDGYEIAGDKMIDTKYKKGELVIEAKYKKIEEEKPVTPKPNPEVKPTTPEEPKQEEAPNTGDENVLLLVAISLVCVISIMKVKKQLCK